MALSFDRTSRTSGSCPVFITGLVHLVGVRPVFLPCRTTGGQGTLSYDRASSMYYIYILLLSNGNLYTGQTTDLKRRCLEHKYGKVISTRPFLPHRLLHYECYVLKSDSLRRERFLKKTEGKRLLRMQIRDILREIN